VSGRRYNHPRMPLSIRRLQIALARRRQRPGSGSPLAFLLKRTADVQWPDLSGVLDVPWCVVGAVATRLYMPERATADLDVAVAGADADRAVTAVRTAGFESLGDLSIGGSAWRTPEGQAVDLLYLLDEWAGEAIAEAQGNRDLQGLPVMPLPYLAILKLDASRLQDVADLGRMLGQAGDDQLAAVREAVARWRPADSEDLEALIASGRWELGLQ